MAAPRDVKFRIVARDFTRGAFRTIGRAVGGLRRAITSLNTLILGFAGTALVRFATATASANRTVVQFARGLNLPVRVAKLLEVVFKQVGGNIRDVDDLFGQLSGNLDALQRGDASAGQVARDFATLGASLQQIRQFATNPFAALEFIIDKAAEFGRDPAVLAAVNRLTGEEAARQVRAISAEYGSLAEAIPRVADQIPSESDILKQAEAAERVAEAYAKLEEALTRLAVEGGALDLLVTGTETIATNLTEASRRIESLRAGFGGGPGQTPVDIDLVLGFLGEQLGRLLSSSQETASNTRNIGNFQ